MSPKTQYFGSCVQVTSHACQDPTMRSFFHQRISCLCTPPGPIHAKLLYFSLPGCGSEARLMLIRAARMNPSVCAMPACHGASQVICGV